MSASSIKLPPGLFVSGVAVGKFELVSGVNAKGKPYSKVVGRGIAGSQFVKVQQFLQPGEAALLFDTNEPFQGRITGVDGFEKGREVVSVFVALERPVLAEVKK